MIKEAFQDFKRLRQIGLIAARHGFADYLNRSDWWQRMSGNEKIESTPESKRESTARRFRRFLNDLGPTFIKLGQILSTRGDILPGEFIEELSKLQDDVDAISIDLIQAQLRESFGRDPAELFSSIDPVPLAAASIAQVHRAVTRDGQEVVIKVQRPGIAAQIRSDLSVLRSLARMLEAVVEETGIYTPTGIIDEFDVAIHQELDFLNEAANVKAFHLNHVDRPFVVIPQVYETLSTRTVLTLEFIQGVKMRQVDLTKHDRETLAKHVIEAAFRQTLEDRLFHGDPHPGNILVLEGDRMALLDFGIVGRLTRQMQETIVMLSLAIALKDSDSVARILYRVAASNSRAELGRFRNDIDDILNRYLTGSTTLAGISARNLLSDMLDLAVKYKLRIPKEYALLSRASIALEGVLRNLHPNLNIAEHVLPYAKELLIGRYDPNQLQGGWMKGLLKLQTLATDLPTQLSQILLDLESGKFSVNVRADELAQINTNLRAAAVIAFLGFCACGFIVGAFMSFAQTPWLFRGVPVLGLMGVSAAAALFGAAISWYLFAGRVRKIRIQRLFRRR